MKQKTYLFSYGLKKLSHYIFLELKMSVRRFVQNSYSQWGEDIIIDQLLGGKSKGFYVDIGAYDPSRFSNTKMFYLRGWKGINIEPDPDRIKTFQKQRTRDINLNLGIGEKSGLLKFYIFEPNTLSTFSGKQAEKYKNQGFKSSQIKMVPVQKLADILTKYKAKEIDLMNIDTEGLDLEVLKSNNWKKFRPHIICVEKVKGVERFLVKIGYKNMWQTPTNLIYLYNQLVK